MGLPRWLLKFLRKRRQNKFLAEFANSLDVVVRGVKAGLPVNDCFQMIATEASEPVRGEFRLLVEAQRVGVPLDDGLERMFERMPLPEVNFLAIVMAIQKDSGGNLAEALGNLSKVLRERKKMHGKIRAMSQEAKSSAAIIGSLPILVMGVVYITTPDYITTLWTDPFGQVMLGFSALWMMTGVLVMRKMINFDF
jgi:tight adherence protein B